MTLSNPASPKNRKFSQAPPTRIAPAVRQLKRESLTFSNKATFIRSAHRDETAEPPEVGSRRLRRCMDCRYPSKPGRHQRCRRAISS